jgi:hypothetical protein
MPCFTPQRCEMIAIEGAMDKRPMRGLALVFDSGTFGGLFLSNGGI